MMKFISLSLVCAGVAIAAVSPAYAQASDSAATPFVLNSLFLLICGALVMFMAAGFTMLEAGSARARSVVTVLIKNITLYAIAGIMFYVVGYNLLFGVPEGGFFGALSVWAPQDAAAGAENLASYSANAYWFFQMVFVATAASVVSGCLAERIRLWPFLIFVAVLSGVIYPIVGGWTWGGGWLASLGFSDFAGSTIVHSVGGWAALAGAILLGPRKGRFMEGGLKQTMPSASAPQIAIGVLILWFGWFGFNGGSRLSFSTVEDAIAVAGIFANTNAAAAGGVLTALIASQLIRGKPDFLLTMNGALAGLVAITAEPLSPSIGISILIGAGGGLVMVGGAKLLELWKIDDVVGAVPVHLAAGVYGTLAAALTNSETNFFIQLFGVAIVGAFTFGVSFLSWMALKATMGLRLHSSAEDIGADMSEVGMRAYHFDFADSPIGALPQKKAA